MNNGVVIDITDFKDKKNLFVGISGGPDSMYLAHRLLEINKYTTLLYFNHGTQNSTQEYKKIKTQFPHAKIITGKTNKKLTTETQFRNERFKFFDTHVLRGTLFLGHHLDDRIETTILNNKKGCGIIGILGIKPTGHRNNYNIVRPLISVPKSFIVSECDKLGIIYHIDKTNFDTKLTPRNTIRENLRKRKDNHENRLFFYDKIEQLYIKRLKNLTIRHYKTHPNRKETMLISFTVETELDIETLLYNMGINGSSRLFCKQLYALFTTNKNGNIYYRGWNFFFSFGKNYALKGGNKFREIELEDIGNSVSFFNLSQGLKYKPYRFGDRSGKTKIKKMFNQLKIPVFMRKIIPLQDLGNKKYVLPENINNNGKYW